MLLSSLAYLIPPVREGLASDDPLVAMMTTISIWPFLLSFYLLFALLLTRYVDHRPLRAAGLTLNRRAVLSLLTGTGIAVGILCCIKAVFLLLGAGEFMSPLKGDLTAMPLWLIIALMATRLMMVVADAFIFSVVAPRIDISLPAFTPCTRPPIKAPRNSIRPALESQPKLKVLPSA